MLRRVEPETSLAERLERIVLGGVRRYTRGDVERRSGVPAERNARLWRALGFADVAEDDVVFTDADVEALQLIDGLVGSGVIDPSLEGAVARAAGLSLSRLAEWEIGLLNDFLSSDDHAPGQVDEAAVIRFAETVLPLMEHLHSYIWRRHVAAVAGRALAASPDELESHALVVGFADVVGYTRLTRNLGETELAALLERFESLVAEVVVNAGGRVVKTLGDGVLFVVDDPRAAASIGLDLVDAVEADPEQPGLRVGLARGNVLSRFGDVYGPVVNIASRLTTAAKRGTVLVDRELATALAGEHGLRLRRRRPISVRGYAGLTSWRLTRDPAGVVADAP
jgi:adenylate cyclase